MATPNAHPEFERARVCKQCQAPFMERMNLGRYLCRMHADRRLTREGQYTCCNYPLHDMQFALDDFVDGADFFGCVPCDHSELRADTMPLVACVPIMYLERGMVERIPAAAVAATVTADMMRTLLARTHRPLLAVPRVPPHNAEELDLVELSFRVLLNFAASDYWHMQQIAEFAAPRRALEALLDRALITDTWDLTRDANDASLVRVHVADAEHNGFDSDASAESELARPTRASRDLKHTRVAFVREMRRRHDTRSLLEAFIPFAVVRRQAPEKYPLTMLHIADYNARVTDARKDEVTKPLRRHDL